MESLKQVESERGKVLLIFKNFKFSDKGILKSGEKKWRCTLKSCGAKLYTIGEGNDLVIVRNDATHNHNENVQKLQRQIVSAQVKRKATEDILERPAKICRQTLLLEDHGELQTSDVCRIKRNLYNARRKIIPALPTCIEDVHSAVNSLQVMTNRSEDFVMCNDPNLNLIIFSCMTNLRYLSKAKTIFADGTFTYCTKFFYQLFIIHGYYNGHYVPLVFCLLKDKTEKTYIDCLKSVISICIKSDLVFEPETVTIDFEQAIHNGVKSVWPTVNIVGCRFHLSQAWWRKIQNLGLSSEYKNEESDVGKWLKSTFGLQYLDASEVGDCLAIDLAENQPIDPRVTQYVDYLVDNYVSEEARFSPEIWACKTHIMTRSTNACESFHSHFKSNFYSTHPSIFIFIETLKNVQIDIYIALNSLGHPKTPSVATRNKENRLKGLINYYDSNKISRLQFVKNVSHYMSEMFS